MMRLSALPSFLVGLRVGIAPLLVWDALDHGTTAWFLTGYMIAVLSDISDGIIARRLGVSTVQLRQADSWADMTLYFCVALSTWLIYPAVITDFAIPLGVAIAAQLALFATSLIKFGQLPSFHTFTAKAWGITLLIATIGLFGFGYAPTLWLAIAFCVLNSVEEIVMTLVLPEWQHDVLSLVHALKLRDIAKG
ncbi:CDP-diacylglycerol--glycerol-3-phosphate 3-phosphatidyltransferase [Phormidium sp. FACHB-592]|uniref:CDP-alcohol phosphatidyltransferase family protein n=1 Tax=Stenomitos frigidus AS-A4 TaxID=2933935 RepID=A0ABV0KJR5_9CYAN|nr:CDP-alcohol phosphatidyltransferase family protein [Phormidium sp. FACHB-592]MBD2074536.1 CDP-diacylglycerol--glycerol-3-phosphate 3-phosphatidyltransferase [Phormidium sp. FACHB-592]